MDLLTIFGLIFIIFFGLLSAVVSFYVYVKYCHPLDKDFPLVWPVRVIIIIGFAASIFNIFLIPVDYMATYEKRGEKIGINLNL